MTGPTALQALEVALAARGGAARWKTLVGLGISASCLHRAVACGAVSRPVRGVVALHGAPHNAVVIAAFGGSMTCVSQLHHVGVPLRQEPNGIHVCLGQSQHRVATADALRHAMLHRSWSAPDARAAPGVPATTVATALEIASECPGSLDHLIAADGALRLGLVTQRDLDFTRPRARERGRWLARHTDARADSLLETVARWALTDAGFRVQSQVGIPGVGRVDLLVDDAVVVELDGREHHSDREAFDTDRRRDRLLLAWGLKVLRFTYSDVMPTGSRVVEDVRGALAADSVTRVSGLRRW